MGNGVEVRAKCFQTIGNSDPLPTTCYLYASSDGILLGVSTPHQRSNTINALIDLPSLFKLMVKFAEQSPEAAEELADIIRAQVQTDRIKKKYDLDEIK